MGDLYLLHTANKHLRCASESQGFAVIHCFSQLLLDDLPPPVRSQDLRAAQVSTSPYQHQNRPIGANVLTTWQAMSLRGSGGKKQQQMQPTSERKIRLAIAPLLLQKRQHRGLQCNRFDPSRLGRRKKYPVLGPQELTPISMSVAG